jgi:hypothetical protein
MKTQIMKYSYSLGSYDTNYIICKKEKMLKISQTLTFFERNILLKEHIKYFRVLGIFFGGGHLIFKIN